MTTAHLTPDKARFSILTLRRWSRRLAENGSVQAGPISFATRLFAALSPLGRVPLQKAFLRITSDQ